MSNNNFNLGRLNQVDLRTVWSNEADHFTPWLAEEENLKLLGDAIGIELELEAQEKNVGPFRADILCKNTADDNWVLIENQLEKTDHIHLGQLLTYAAGLKAVTIVWISKRFTEEHRAALDWLNEITDDRFNFFGLEVELWKIGDSKVAPKFNMVSEPNDWSRSVAEGASQVRTSNLTESQLLQKEYWLAFFEYVNDNSINVRPSKPYPQHWMNIPIGKGGIKLNAIASLYGSDSKSYSTNEIRVELEMYDKRSKQYYEQLLLHKDEISSKITQPMNWYNPDDAQVCRIFIKKTVNIKDKNDWPEQHKWLLDNLELFYDAFHDLVKGLELN